MGVRDAHQNILHDIDRLMNNYLKTTMNMKKIGMVTGILGVTAVGGTFAASFTDIFQTSSTGNTKEKTSVQNTNHRAGMGMHKGGKTDAEKAAMKDKMATDVASVLSMTKEEVVAALATGKSPLDLAKAKGLSETDFETKIHALRLADIKAKLQSEVASGTITQAQADTKLAQAAAHKGGMKGMCGGHRGNGKGDAAMTKDLASVLGIDEATLIAKLASGKTVKDVIVESGKNEADIKAKMDALRETHMKEMLKTEVLSGKMTQVEADAKLLQMKNHSEGHMGGMMSSVSRK